MRLQAALRRAEEAEGRLGKAEVMAAAAREAAGVEVVVTVGEEARLNVNASANVDRGAAAEERASEAALLAAQADASAVAAEAAAAAVGASGLAGAANVEEADTGGAWEAAAASAGRQQEQLGELAGDIAEVTGDDAEVTGDLDEMTSRTCLSQTRQHNSAREPGNRPFPISVCETDVFSNPNSLMYFQKTG